MTGEEFVEKILAGVRDFSGINLEKKFYLDEHKRFQEMQDYLKRQDLGKNPIIINDSAFMHLQAQDLYLPFVRGSEADLSGADLAGAYLVKALLVGADLMRANLVEANLEEANIKQADLVRANLKGANLEGTFLKGADFRGANLNGANLERAYLGFANFEGANLEEAKLLGANLNGANLEGADLRGADLSGVMNLGKAIGLESANYKQTIVSGYEEEIIKKALKNALKNKVLFVVRGWVNNDA